MMKREPRWYFVAYSLALGGLMAVAGVIGDQPWLAVASIPIMGVFGVAMALTPWGTMRQGSQDEREQVIGKEAALISYYVVVVLVIASFLVEVAQGDDGQPWSSIGFVTGVSFAVSLGVLSRRREFACIVGRTQPRSRIRTQNGLTASAIGASRAARRTRGVSRIT